MSKAARSVVALALVGFTGAACSQSLPSAAPEDVGMDGGRLRAIDGVMERAIARREVPGGVVLVARSGKVVHFQAYGKRSLDPPEPTTTDTIYDMASVTKPVATASSIVRLAEMGYLSFEEPVVDVLAEWKAGAAQDKAQKTRVPSFGAGVDTLLRDLATSRPRLSGKPLETPTWEPVDREKVHVRHLLTHSAGLPPFINFGTKNPSMAPKDALSTALKTIGSAKLTADAGERFVYSDLGFITLGAIVERRSKQSLDEFARREIFQPLHMVDTGFKPAAALLPRIAPTEFTSDTTVRGGKRMLRGTVHDPNASWLGGISGHAGLFSTASDLARFCQMLLNGGELDGVRVFSPVTVDAMIHDQSRLPVTEAESFGYGWNIATSYSGPRGDFLTGGFGHTGWTGTSVWIVPEEELFIIILTNRVHPDGTGDSKPLRAQIANVVAASIIEFADPLHDHSDTPATAKRTARSGKFGISEGATAGR